MSGGIMPGLRNSFRTYLRAPGFTAAAVLVLGLGIGATTAIFTLVNSLLLKPLPYPDSDRLVWVWGLPPHSGFGYNALLGPDFLEIKAQNQSFSSVGGMSRLSWNVTGAGEPQRLSGAMVTEGFFETLGVRPVVGRTFTPEEYHSGHDAAVVFSHRFWLQRFGGDSRIVGRHVNLDGIPYEVVGIMPPEFVLGTDFDMWAPLPAGHRFLTGLQYRHIRTFARLKPGVDVRQAQAEMTARAADFAQRNPYDRDYSMRLAGFDDQEVGSVRTTLWVFAAAVASVLLIACSNVASLLLARGAVRVREMAVRAAVGASRMALVRQLLWESALLGLAGGTVGLPLAIWGVQLLLALDPSALPRSGEIHADGRVLAFAVLLSLLTGLIFGIVPALRGSRVSLLDALKEGGRGGTGSLQGNRFRSALVVIEVALGVVLMATAGLLVRSFQALTEVRPGYDARNVLAMDFALTDVRYRDVNVCARFFERLITQVEQLPGVEAAGSTNYLPLGKDKNLTNVWLDTEPLHTQQTSINLDNRVVTPGYFRAIGVPLLAGRFFEWSDRRETPKVLIVNEAFARQFYPHGAVGRRIATDFGGDWVGEIIGVVGDFRERSVAEAPTLELFSVLNQTPIAGQTLTVRSNRDPASLINGIRNVLGSIDKDVPFFNQRTMQQQLDQSIAQPRLRGTLLGLLSIVALALASMGVYGVIACAVAERRKEIGIRLALGAQSGEVRRMVVIQGLRLTLAGLALGLAGAVTATRLVQGLLFGVGPGDPVTFFTTAGVFVTVALVASFLPARSATSVDPLTVLREE
ncbi:MAG: ABC transporter permease [Bryobacteraceae bacterium]|jgi:putative ABC transport system permease protein